MKNKKLRMIWIIPNVFCYVMVIGFSTFVLTNAKGLEVINSLSLWVFMLLLLLLVSIFGSHRIWTWVKEGKCKKLKSRLVMDLKNIIA